MNVSRRHLARFAAAAAAVSSLAVGFAASPAHASNCETQPNRVVLASDVQKSEDNTTMWFKIETWGCLHKAELYVTNYYGDAKEYVDYVPVFTVLKWAEGDASPRWVGVQIKEDQTIEANEKFGLVRHVSTWSNIDSKHILAVGTIIDDDYPVVY